MLLGTFPFNASGSGYKVDLADTSLTGKVVADAIYYVQDGAPVDSFTWTPTIPSAGEYRLYARWTASSANSGAAQYTVVHGGGTSLVTVSQKQNGGQWNLLGTWSFAPGAGHQVTLTASSDGNVVADAIKLVGAGPAPADLVYLHSDPIGLPQKITDSTQAIVWDRVQDPFGRQVSLTSSGGIDTALRFPGQQADPDTGFAYNYFRDYDPTLGRYVQADPIGLGGGLNGYGYVGANPLARSDPMGLVPNPAEAACLAGPNPVCLAGAAADLITTAVPIIAAIVGVGALSMSGDTPTGQDKAFDEAIGAAGENSCNKGDDDRCYERWVEERAYCKAKYGEFGTNWILLSCYERARLRWVACLRGVPEPPQWSDADIDGWQPPKPPGRRTR